jgi:Na+/alanine symporter
LDDFCTSRNGSLFYCKDKIYGFYKVPFHHERNLWKYIYLALVVVGSLNGLKFVWFTLDLIMGLAVLPNIYALLRLSPEVFSLQKDFFLKEKL